MLRKGCASCSRRLSSQRRTTKACAFEPRRKVLWHEPSGRLRGLENSAVKTALWRHLAATRRADPILPQGVSDELTLRKYLTEEKCRKLSDPSKCSFVLPLVDLIEARSLALDTMIAERLAKAACPAGQMVDRSSASCHLSCKPAPVEVVLLGAGFDGRAFMQLSSVAASIWSRCRLWHVDTPRVVNQRRQLFGPLPLACGSAHDVAADLFAWEAGSRCTRNRSEGTLVGAEDLRKRFAACAHVIILLEGVLEYFPTDFGNSLIRVLLHEFAPRVGGRTDVIAATISVQLLLERINAMSCRASPFFASGWSMEREIDFTRAEEVICTDEIAMQVRRAAEKQEPKRSQVDEQLFLERGVLAPGALQVARWTVQGQPSE